jgi:adenosylcobinamide-phosphate synthase
VDAASRTPLPTLPGSSYAAGLLLGVLLDALIADPRRGHPVAGYGRIADLVERRSYVPSRASGVLHLIVLVSPAVALSVAAERRLRRRPGSLAAGVAAVTWTVLGASGLRREAQRIGRALEDGDLAAARAALPTLCGRDADLLDAAGLARAVVESVAENTSDAAVGPLWWGALAGLPGLVAYRAINTLDAMIGHRSERYEDFGWAAARLDDLANLAPARLTAALAALLAPAVGGQPADAVRAWRTDAAAHPSPNAGPCEAAFAGALGVRLGGVTIYPYGVSVRPTLGDGRPVEAGDIARAALLSRHVTLAAAACCAGLALLLGHRPCRGEAAR